jgi:aquaporin Z
VELWRKGLAELVGTFFVTLVPTLVDLTYFSGHGVDAVSRWLARGFIAAAMIFSFAGVSGAHLDPAVSLAFWARGVFATRKLALYVVAQFIGALLASALVFAAFGTAIRLGASRPGPASGPLEAFACEVVLTLMLVIVILATARREAAIGRESALAIGLTIAAAGFAGGTISGASMNPARSLAPQLFAGQFSLMWIYAAGPAAGALLAALLAPFVFGSPDRGERHAARGQ